LPNELKQIVLDYTGCFFQWNDFSEIFAGIEAVLNYNINKPDFGEIVYKTDESGQTIDDTKQCCIADYFSYSARDYTLFTDEDDQLTLNDFRLETTLFTIPRGTCSVRDILNVIASCEAPVQSHSSNIMYLERMHRYDDGVWYGIFGT
jgi:hypothetical protein